MAVLTTKAYVLRIITFGDTSRIVVLFGKDVGKFRAIAKGYRNPKSGCARALELFREVEIVYYHRPGRDLQIASRADIVTYHDGLDRDTNRFFYGCAALELCDLILPEEEPAPTLYNELSRTLGVLATTSGARAALVFRSFQARACAMAGFLPELEMCAVCDGDVQAERLFSAEAGGFVCQSCAARGTSVETISPEAAGLFRFLLRADPGAVAEAWTSLLRPAAVEVARFIEGVMAAHIERYRGLRSLETLGHTLRGARSNNRSSNREAPPNSDNGISRN
jgi:DNA repair protein RecO (recombination protein O)